MTLLTIIFGCAFLFSSLVISGGTTNFLSLDYFSGNSSHQEKYCNLERVSNGLEANTTDAVCPACYETKGHGVSHRCSICKENSNCLSGDTACVCNFGYQNIGELLGVRLGGQCP
jgi:hypothetical protein